MKIEKKSFTFYGFHLFLISLAFFVLFFLVRWIDLKRNDPEAIRTRIEKILKEKEGTAEKRIERIWAGKGWHEEADREQDAGITVFVYSGDTLSYWSGNEVPGQREVLNPDETKPLVALLENGFYRVISKDSANLHVMAFILLSQEYPFQNEYLVNGMQEDFGIHQHINISKNRGKYNITESDGTFLFSFTPDQEKALPAWPGLLFGLFLGGFIFGLLWIFRLYCAFEYVFRDRTLFILSFLTDVLILRAVQMFFRWPRALYETSYFSPDYYFHSACIPSFGDLIIHSVMILIVAAVVYLKWSETTLPGSRWKYSKVVSVISYALIPAVLLTGVIYLIRSLVENSNFPMDLQDLTALNNLSLAGFTVISLLFLSLYLFFVAFEKRILPLVSGTITRPFFSSFTGVLVFMILSAFLATLILNDSNTAIEKERRRLIAMKLATRRNPVTEEEFAGTANRITADTLLLNKIRLLGYGHQYSDEQAVAEYLAGTYFTGYWNNFSVQVTVCVPGKMLRIQPQDYLDSCDRYFTGLIRDFGKETFSPALWYLDFGYGNENYLARITPGETGVNVYVEFSLKQAYKDLGYPELLVDKSISNLPDLSDYSYGYYQQGQLVRRVGQYAYGFELAAITDTTGDSRFFNSNGQSHYLYRIDAENTMIIGKPIPTLLSRISPFSYLFIWFSLSAFLFYIVFHFRHLREQVTNSFRNRLQVAFLGIILSSFIIVGIVVTAFLARLNAEKDKENLLERALSITVEMQHKFGSAGNLSDVNQGVMGNTLVKFSNVFFSDINVYGTEGWLVASSRPQIFEEGLISPLMNPVALNRLQNGSESMIVLREHIGKHQFLSAYLPMYNDRNERTGYINLPYFSRQAELRGEVSYFMGAFINIYVLFILLGVIIAFVISGYLTAPLKMLAQKIGHTNLLKTNDKIDWKRSDEVGKLVAEYNRMLDELKESVEKLASSERESAWREMARQVAHEIKNPLTPMKLSIQHLEKSWNEGAPEWEQRLKRFSASLIEQIESLSAIATEFSDFAKMPAPVNERLELNEVIQSALMLYKGISAVNFSVVTDGERRMVYCDRKQLLRILNNLINNAVQAIGQNPEGQITITIAGSGKDHEIRVSDNGPGIPPEQKDRIFRPNFTTKSGGTGLGLAIVREIITSQGGSISFISQQGAGTTFIIILPAV